MRCNGLQGMEAGIGSISLPNPLAMCYRSTQTPGKHSKVLELLPFVSYLTLHLSSAIDRGQLLPFVTGSYSGPNVTNGNSCGRGPVSGDCPIFLIGKLSIAEAWTTTYLPITRRTKAREGWITIQHGNGNPNRHAVKASPSCGGETVGDAAGRRKGARTIQQGRTDC